MMRTERTLHRTIIISLVLSLASVLLIVTARSLPTDKQWLSTILTNIGSFFLASVVLALVFELWQKKTFLEEIFAEAKIVEQVRSAGIIGFSPGFHETVNWGELFAKSTSLDIVFAYASTWRNVHGQSIEQLASKDGARIRVVLPDYTNEVILNEMAHRFSVEPPELQRRIQEAIAFFIGLDDRHPGTVTIYLMTRSMVFTFYRFNNEAVLALYRHPPERLKVPSLVAQRGGILYSFLVEEWKKITEAGVQAGWTRKVYPADPNENI